MTSAPTTVYLFAGDSLTEGVFGESYVERVGRALYQGRYGLAGEVINAGRGCDTVRSLLDRIDEPLRQRRPQWVVLAVGGNDVWLPWLSDHSLGWKLWFRYRGLRWGQTPTTDLDQFAAAYRALMDKARQAGARVLACTVSPLGERLSSPVNRRLARLNGVIKHVAADRQTPVADVWQAFVEAYAALEQPSAYLPGEWLFVWLDRRRLRTVSPDELSRRRRLHFTFDGIHLNSRGADLWADVILAALAQAQERATAWGLPCFAYGPLRVCHTPGWEARAGDLAHLLAAAYERLAALTEARPAVALAVLNRVQWEQLAAPLPYPIPASRKDDRAGAVFAPEAYTESFLRDFRLPETVAAWTAWPPALAELGELARATALADLLAVQEMARLFLRERKAALADPALHRLLAAYLTQAALHAREGQDAAQMAALWNAWGEALARAGIEEGRIRQQARDLFEAHGPDLVMAIVGQPASLTERLTTEMGG